eukprot:356317-Chlamydomonas_euryale.AAC.2
MQGFCARTWLAGHAALSADHGSVEHRLNCWPCPLTVVEVLRINLARQSKECAFQLCSEDGDDGWWATLPAKSCWSLQAFGSASGTRRLFFQKVDVRSQESGSVFQAAGANFGYAC